MHVSQGGAMGASMPAHTRRPPILLVEVCPVYDETKQCAVEGHNLPASAICLWWQVAMRLYTRQVFFLFSGTSVFTSIGHRCLQTGKTDLPCIAAKCAAVGCPAQPIPTGICKVS